MTSMVTTDNVRQYATPESLEAYTRTEGLWPIEEVLINEFMPRPPARILDIGCGAGRTTVGLARAGYHALAIDLSEEMLAAARQRYRDLRFERMDATALAFAPETFDAAIFSFNGIDCIHPAASRVRCLSEVFRVLRPAGVFVLSSHNGVGHFFSGGYFYARGYVNAMRMLAQQWRNPYLRDWYFRYPESGGGQYLFSAPPARTVAQLRDAGFEVLDVRGSSGERRPARIRYRQAHVYFTARKPAR